MENWQITLIVLASVFVGAMMPVLVIAAIGIYRAGSAVTVLSRELTPVAGNLRVVSERVEKISRGLDGGEKSVADIVHAVGELSGAVERGVKAVNFSTLVLSSIGPAVAAFIRVVSGDGSVPASADQSGKDAPARRTAVTHVDSPAASGTPGDGHH